MKAALPYAAIGLGLILLALSTIWPKIFPGTAIWTPEKAARWSEIQVRLHNLGPTIKNPSRNISMHGGSDYGQLKKEYDDLTVEHDALQVDFESAAIRPHSTAKFLKWSGISLGILGIIGYYAVNQSR